MRPKRQKVAVAILGSVFLHGIALVIFALVVALRPPAPEAPPTDESLKLEIVEEEPLDTPPPIIPDAVATPTPTPHLLVDATGPDADSPPPADAVLSDRSTRGSSAEQDASSQAGAKQSQRKTAVFQFDPSPPAPGLVTHAATPPPETAPALPQPDRSATRPVPTPLPLASASPPPAAPLAAATPDEFAMAMTTPPPLPEDPFDPSIRSTSPPLPKPAERPKERSTPTPAVGSTHSATSGTAPIRGAGGVDTLATPSSRYTHQVTDMIKYVWSRSIERRADVAYGTAIIHCTIDKDGLVLAPRIASNTADVLFGSIALQAVAVARLPPMPADVAEDLHGKLGLDITFDLTPMPQEAALH